MNSFPELQENITIIKQEQLFTLMRKKSARMICFPSAVLMDRMAYNNDGGIFAGFFSADWMRADWECCKSTWYQLAESIDDNCYIKCIYMSVRRKNLQ